MKKQVVVDGLMTSYIQQGDGPDLLLLHGWADKKETFQNLLPALDGHKVTALDLPGFGETEAPQTAWNLTNYAEFLSHFAEKLGLEPTVIAGHSNGGALAIHGLATKRLTSKKLVLFAASGVRSSGGAKRSAIKLVAKTGKVATLWLPTSTRQKLQKKLYGTVGSDMLVAPHLQETFKQTVRQDVQQDATKLDLPVLLIYGEQDKATPLSEVGEVLHSKIKNSHLVVVHGADHFVHQQLAPEQVQIIKEFIA